MSGIDITPFRIWFSELPEKEKHRVISRLADECLENGSTYNFTPRKISNADFLFLYWNENYLRIRHLHYVRTKSM
jgi:hypothetical protein